MTVSSLTTKNSYSGNGSTSAFSYTFKIFDDDDVTVIIRTDSTGTETVKTKTTHYTVSGVGSASGGTITFTSGNIPASGETVLLLRNTPLTQATDYTPNDPFPAATHEDALDKLTLISQDTQEEIDRSIKLSRANTMTSTEFTVPAATRANKIFAFDSSGELAVTQEIGTFKGDWAASTAYAVRDLVKDTSTNNIFIVNEAHTSSGSQPLTTNANSAKYDLIVDAASATTSASAAASSATAAASSASTASTQASNASSSASTASTQASNASTSASTASTQASNASSSATAAASSATAAANSATAAANSAAALTVSDSNANTNFPVVFHDESNALLDDTGGLRYNPSTGELLAPKINVSGTDLFVSRNVDVDGTLEADAMTLNGTAITATATLDTGISNNNVPKFTSGVADDDFLRVDGTAIEGRSASEVLSDIGGQASLTFGISNTNAVKIDSSSVADDEYARFTANGLESRATSEVLSDIGAQASLTFGISNTNAVKIDSSSVADDEYARFTASGLESRSNAEVLSDIGALPLAGGSMTGAVTITTADNNAQVILKSTDADADAGPFIDLQRDSGSPADNDFIGKIRFAADDDAGNVTEFAQIHAQILDASNGSEDGALQIRTTVGGSVGQPKLDFLATETVFNEGSNDVDFRVEGNGNANAFFVQGSDDFIGIGTGTPKKKLHIQDTTSDGIIILDRNDTSTDHQICFAHNYQNGGQSGGNYYAIGVDDSENKLVFAFDANSQASLSADAKVVLDSSGNLIVGDTASVSAGKMLVKFDRVANSGIVTEHTNGTSTTTHMTFRNSNGNVGSIQVSASSTAFNTSSDYRLKENVADMTGAIDRVKALAPKRFNFTADADTTVDGFLAHEAQTVVPEAVTGTKDETREVTNAVLSSDGRLIGEDVTEAKWTAGKLATEEDGKTIPAIYPSDSTWSAKHTEPVMQGIDQAKLVPLLTGALQEAIAEIETLKTKVAALEAG